MPMVARPTRLSVEVLPQPTGGGSSSAEARTAVALRWVAKVRVIDEVERLQPQLQAPVSAHGQVLEERDVPALEARRPQTARVAAPDAEGARRRPCEGRRVEPEVLVHAPAV